MTLHVQSRKSDLIVIVWRIKRFHLYLYGVPLRVADSPLTVKYLKYMDSARHANAQLMRWVMFLQRYNFKVEAIDLTIFLFPFLLKRGLCCEKLSSVTSVTLHDYSQIVYFRSSVSVLLLDLFEPSRTRLRI